MSFRSRLIRPATRLYPLASGCTFPNRRLFRRLVGTPQERVWVRVRGGWIEADLSDYVGRCAYFVGEIDRKVSQIFARFVRPGDTVLDIGANIGLTTLRLSALTGPQGRVHAFEPQPELSARLGRALERSRLANVTVHRCALGDREGTATLCVPDRNAGKASIMPASPRAGLRRMEVPLRRLDDVLPDLAALRLLKIDVEGAEAQVLAGGEGTLARLRPDVVLFEANAQDEEAGPRRIGAILEGLDYRLFGLPKAVFRVRPVEASPEALTQSRFHDFVALAGGPGYAERRARLKAAP